MEEIEELETDAHRAQLKSDVRGLVDKYRAIFGWDVPEVDETLSDRLIVEALRQALDELVLDELVQEELPVGVIRPAAGVAR